MLNQYLGIIQQHDDSSYLFYLHFNSIIFRVSFKIKFVYNPFNATK